MKYEFRSPSNAWMVDFWFVKMEVTIVHGEFRWTPDFFLLKITKTLSLGSLCLFLWQRNFDRFRGSFLTRKQLKQATWIFKALQFEHEIPSGQSYMQNFVHLQKFCCVCTAALRWGIMFDAETVQDSNISFVSSCLFLGGLFSKNSKATRAKSTEMHADFFPVWKRESCPAWIQASVCDCDWHLLIASHRLLFVSIGHLNVLTTTHVPDMAISSAPRSNLGSGGCDVTHPGGWIPRPIWISAKCKTQPQNKFPSDLLPRNLERLITPSGHMG